MGNVTSFIQTALPYLAWLGVILLLLGVGVAPNTRTKGVILFIIGVIMNIVGGLSASELSLPFSRSFIIGVIALITGGAAGAVALIRHIQVLSDSAIPLSLIAAACFFVFGWAIAGPW